MTDEYRQAISCSHSDAKVLGQSCFVPGSKIGAIETQDVPLLLRSLGTKKTQQRDEDGEVYERARSQR